MSLFPSYDEPDRRNKSPPVQFTTVRVLRYSASGNFGVVASRRALLQSREEAERAASARAVPEEAVWLLLKVHFRSLELDSQDRTMAALDDRSHVAWHRGGSESSDLPNPAGTPWRLRLGWAAKFRFLLL